MKKVIILIVSLPVAAMVCAVIYLSLPWTIMALYAEFCVPEPEQPVIAEESFPFTMVYELNGKEIMIEDKMICKYAGSECNEGDFVKYRTWDMKLESGGDSIVLWEGKNRKGEKQRIVLELDPAYYMDDVGGKYDAYETPDQDCFFYPEMAEEEYHSWYVALETTDSDGDIDSDRIRTKKKLSKYGIKIVSWKCRQPIENSFE